MSAPTTISPDSVDRILRGAGHQRQDRRHRYLRPSTGYTVDWGGQGVVEVTWSSWADLEGQAAYDHDYHALIPLRETLVKAAYRVSWGEGSLPADSWNGELRWPCLIVTVREVP